MAQPKTYAELRRFYYNVAYAHGCKCDPPGSGEEWCVGTCVQRARAERVEAERDILIRDGASKQWPADA